MNPAFTQREPRRERIVRRVRRADELTCPTCESHKVEQGKQFVCRRCGETWVTIGLKSG